MGHDHDHDHPVVVTTARGTMTHRPAGQWETIRQIRGANRDAGFHWFDNDTIKSFGSTIHQQVYGGRYFVSSEKDPEGILWGGTRRYTIRKAEDNGRIATVGEFGQYRTSVEAHRDAKRFGAGEPEAFLFVFGNMEFIDTEDGQVKAVIYEVEGAELLPDDHEAEHYAEFYGHEAYVRPCSYLVEWRTVAHFPVDAADGTMRCLLCELAPAHIKLSAG